MQDEYNILYKTEIQFGYQECLIKAKEESQQILTQVKDSASNSVSSVIDSTANYSAEKWEELKNSTNKALNPSNETTDKVFETFSYE
ncbi:hypothetical protein GCM10025856_13330 [Methylophaga marina]|uniref:Phasin domain-containing protein n=1 Tax=Methylophaga marina TaxID=45495 RepID=A0ABN0TPW6_9GAMM|nr:hypothetical protein [Methylophaga marina]BDZ73614.1 hypothetical protein GCM10025856_13330 [Methylophaga marina]